MNPSEALYYPISYYKGIAASCAHFMTLAFARDPIPYSFEQHERWQIRLERFISRILLAARFDESVAIGAMVLLERFSRTNDALPAYPNEAFFGYFIGALMTSDRMLSLKPEPNEFWAGIMGNPLFSRAKMAQLRDEFVTALGCDTRMAEERFIDIKAFVYTFVYLRMGVRTGVWFAPPAPRLLERPPCHREMETRKALFTSMRAHSQTLRSMSDRDFHRFLFAKRH